MLLKSSVDAPFKKVRTLNCATQPPLFSCRLCLELYKTKRSRHLPSVCTSTRYTPAFMSPTVQ